MGDSELFEWAIAFAITIYPVWRIFAKVGLNPALSLFIAIPFLGFFIAGGILAYSRWPAVSSDEGR